MNTPNASAAQSAHSPGPWANGTARGIFARDLLIASAHSMAHMANPDRESQANARLMAAAPELLAACKSMLETITDLGPLQAAWFAADAGALRQAIARAEGHA